VRREAYRVGAEAREAESMPSTWRGIYTVGRIARRLNEPLHRVEYAVKTRGIEPVGIAGNVRVFEEDAVESVAAALRGIDARRERGTR
jgi:hypothetical protein